MENSRKTTLEMRTLLLCADVQFVGATRAVLNQFKVNPNAVEDCDSAISAIQDNEFDAIVVDWREINNLGEFLIAVRRSKLNRECVLVAIVRDLLDLRQAFAAGVHFLIHKPPSSVQIERCLRAAYCASVARRLKQHREPVHIVAAISTRTRPFADVTIANLSEGGARVELNNGSSMDENLAAGVEVDLRFSLPEHRDMLQCAGLVVWTSRYRHAGIRFSYLSGRDRLLLGQWLTACVERSEAEFCQRLGTACA